MDQAVADRLVEAARGPGAGRLEDLPPGRWEALPRPAAGALSAVRDAAGDVPAVAGRRAARRPRGGGGGRKVALATLDEVADTAFRLLNAFDEPDPARRRDVVWLAEQGPDGARSRVLRAAPLAVGGLLRERLFGRSTVILTSATLALGGTFDALARQWGLPPEHPAANATATPRRRDDDRQTVGDRPPTTLAHGEVQDPTLRAGPASTSARRSTTPSSGILYVARRLPPPGRDGLPARVPGRDRRSWSRPRAAARSGCSPRCGPPSRPPRRCATGSPRRCSARATTRPPLLVRRFAEDEATSLFGTLSLWQGVDVPGRSLSCVIIDRIPFPRPDDPLVARPGSARSTPAAATGS